MVATKRAASAESGRKTSGDREKMAGSQQSNSNPPRATPDNLTIPGTKPTSKQAMFKPLAEHNAGLFKPGPDPRRHIHSATQAAYRSKLIELCKGHFEEAVAFIVDTMRDESADIKVRMTAACELLNRGFGKPVDSVAMIHMDATFNDTAPFLPKKHGGKTVTDIRQMTDEQIILRITKLEAEQIENDADYIEIDPV